MNSTTYSSYTDEELLRRLRGDDQAAFGEIYNRYHQEIYRYALAFLKIPELAEDSVHEVFLKIWEIRGSLDLQKSFNSYLFRMTHNKSVDALKHLVREEQGRKTLLEHYEPSARAEQRSLYELQQNEDLVKKALDALPPQQQKIYRLCKFENYSYDEVAAQLGISRNTVKEHMSKALATLRNFARQKGLLTLLFFLLKKII